MGRRLLLFIPLLTTLGILTTTQSFRKALSDSINESKEQAMDEKLKDIELKISRVESRTSDKLMSDHLHA